MVEDAVKTEMGVQSWEVQQMRNGGDDVYFDAQDGDGVGCLGQITSDVVHYVGEDEVAVHVGYSSKVNVAD